MRLIGNLLWIIVVGLVSALAWALLGLVWCITIVGIPFGIQCFKMGGLVLAPFGKKVNGRFGSHPIANLIWFIFGGFALALTYFFIGLAICITVVGIPFGIQCLKLAKLAAFPFGAHVN